MAQVSYSINGVAPPAGAWIETTVALYAITAFFVAPPAGAWIETIASRIVASQTQVAPPAGAWIETIILA